MLCKIWGGNRIVLKSQLSCFAVALARDDEDMDACAQVRTRTHVRINWPAPLVTRPFHVRRTWGVKHLCGHQRNWKSRGEANQQRAGLKERRLPPETWLLWTHFKWDACSFVVRKDKVHNKQRTQTHIHTPVKLGLFSSSTIYLKKKKKCLTVEQAIHAATCLLLHILSACFILHFSSVKNERLSTWK